MLILGSNSGRSPGLFSLHPLSEKHGMTNVVDRASIVIGVFLAAYGLLVWRNAFRKLSLANYIIALSCAPVLLLCVSKMKGWEYFWDQQRESWTLNHFGVQVIHLNDICLYPVFRYLVGRQHIPARTVSRTYAIQPIREIVSTPKSGKRSLGYRDPLGRFARSIKGRVKRKDNLGDWKERRCSLRSPAQVMLRGSGVFALRRSILFS